VNKANIIKKNENNIIYFLIFVFFIFCSFFTKDFGVTLDDEIYYLNGLNTYEYVKDFFINLFKEQENIGFYRDKLKEWPIIFEFILIFISDLLGLKSIDKIYFLAHQLNFTIFCLSLLIFYKFIKKRFNSFYLSTLSIILIILSPRIFGETFYNTRDIFFMSLFIFYNFAAYLFLEKKNISRLVFFSIFTAILINTKVLAFIPVFVFLLIYIYNFFNTVKKFQYEKKIIIIFVTTTLVSIYILWPFLWSNPIFNLYEAFNNILKVHENLIVVNLYFGNYMQSDMMPWHYRLVWFVITTPVVVLILFLIGMSVTGKKVFISLKNTLNKNFNLENNCLIDLYFFVTFFLTFFLVGELNNSKFGGWRHLYFLYPITIYFSIHGINFITKNFNYRSVLMVYSILFISLTYNLFWIVKNHPNQHLYFNHLNKKYLMKNFDLDWWGVTHKQALDYILINDNNSKINIYAKGFSSLRDTYLYLNNYDKSRIFISNLNNADYIIDNKMKRIRSYENINFNKYSKFYSLKVDDQIVTEVYKKN
tara:strand:+ start:505 stop:2106 length:1602 start_codon:yes stop_codon:yes gene_type:complete